MAEQYTPGTDEDSYTPTIEDLRNAWLEHYTYPEPEVLAAQFDAALAAHDAQVAAKAWDEGRESVALDFTKPLRHDYTRDVSENPYRIAGGTSHG